MNPEPPRLNWHDGNDVRLLENGAQFFPALFDAIDRARVSVHLETYIFQPDRAGQALLERLQAACERGVRLRVVLDGFGSAAHAELLTARIRAMGGQCRVYRPEPRRLARLVPSRQRLRRLHRKIAMIDGQAAFLGGINIVDDYTNEGEDEPSLREPRYDYAVCVRGPIVADVAHALDLLWLRLNWMRLRRPLRRLREARLRHPGYRANPPCGEVRAALALRDNLRFRRTIEQSYLNAIDRAQGEVLIACAYFLPGRRLRRALAAAAARGVRVRLLLQGMAEYRLQQHATRALYEELLAHGIEIHEYMPSFLHAKVAVADGYATVGSSNLDPFSLLLAREANVMVDHAPFAAQLRASLEQAIALRAQPVERQRLGRRGPWLRLADALAYTALRIGVALTGRSSEY